MIFGYKRPNATEGIRLRSLLQPKRLSSQSCRANSGVCPFFFLTYVLINHGGRRIKRQSKNCGQSPGLFLFLAFVLFLLSQIPFGASTSTAAHKNPVKTPCCHYCNHSYQSSRPLAAEAAGRWAGTPSSVGCWSGGAWSQAG